MIEFESRIKAWQYIVFAIAIKAFFFFYFQYLKSPETFQQGIYFYITGDASDYTEPVENLVTFGEHRTNSGSYSLRMPGYTPVLLFFRLFLNFNWALNFTLFTQVIFSGISCFVLALLSFKLFHSKKVFLLTFLVYTISTYVSVWDSYILTESFSVSILIFSFYLLILANERQNKIIFIISSALMTWAIFLRPFLIPLSVLFLMAILFYKRKTKPLKIRLINILIFTLPLVVAEGSWVLRNYLISDQILFTQSRQTYQDENDLETSDFQLQWFIGSFCSSFGGDHTYWNPRGASYWFFNKNTESNKDLFPDEIFNETLTISDLLRVKMECIALTSDTLDKNKTEDYERDIKKTISDFSISYQNDHPFHYHVLSRLIHLKNFIFHTGVYNIPFPTFQEQNIFQKLFKFFYSILYLLIFTIGSVYSLLILMKKELDPFKIIFVLIPFYIILLFPIVYKVHEYRFNTLAYPFLVISLSCSIVEIFMFLKNKLKNKSSLKTYDGNK